MIRLRREGTQVGIAFNMRSAAAAERLFAHIVKALDGDLISIPIQNVPDDSGR